MANKAIINKIIPFSNVDGQGNRCAIFFQGCDSKCVYCHNPETINVCNNCLKCIKVCKYNALSNVDGKIRYNEDNCTACDACINICPFNASPKTREFTVKELLDIIKDYQPFIRGITASGGEATLYKDFLIELFIEIKKLGLTCYIDTNGFFNLEDIKDLIQITDKFLFDIKAINHIKELCKNNCTKNIENMKYLLKQNKIEEVRTVIINGFFDTKKTVSVVSDILKNYDNVLYKLIKVHTKGMNIDQKAKIQVNIPSEEEMFELIGLARNKGVKNIVKI